MENDKFEPLTASHGNVSGDIAYLRDTFLNAEYDYLNELLSDDAIRENFKTLLSWTPEALANYAISMMEKIEYGTLETKEDIENMKGMTSQEKDKYHERNLEVAEGIATLCLAAIQDKVKILELIKTYENDEEEAYTHSM